MKDDALKAAIQHLLNQGEQAKDRGMQKFAAGKKAPPGPECAECHVPFVDGKCPKCGAEAPTAETPAEDDSEGLAGLLEQGARE